MGLEKQKLSGVYHMNFSNIYRQFYMLRGKVSVSCDSTHRFIVALRFSWHWLWRRWLWRRV